MAQRGRKPKPTAVKKLEGNPGKRPLNEFEPRPQKKAPKCPTWIDAEAKKECRRVAVYLKAISYMEKHSVIVRSLDCLDFDYDGDIESSIIKYLANRMNMIQKEKSQKYRVQR